MANLAAPPLRAVHRNRQRMARLASALTTWIAVALWASCAVSADGPRSAPPRTEAIFVTPPDGWVMSVWQGGTIELAEFTPPGQTGDGYVDLLGYSVVPALDGTNATAAEMRAFERTSKTGCRVVRVREHLNTSDEYDSEYLCIGRDHAANPEAVEVEFATTVLGKQSVFRVWRTWRGTPTELTTMLEQRTGRALAPVVDMGSGQQVNEKDFNAAFSALEPSFFRAVARNAICDLSKPMDCAGLHRPLTNTLSLFVPNQPFVAGFIASGLHQLSRDAFRAALGLTGPEGGGPNMVVAALLPSDANWTNPSEFQALLKVVATGQAADGGVLFLIDRSQTMKPDERTLALARILSASRQLWRVGTSPDTTIMVLPR